MVDFKFIMRYFNTYMTRTFVLVIILAYFSTQLKAFTVQQTIQWLLSVPSNILNFKEPQNLSPDKKNLEVQLFDDEEFFSARQEIDMPFNGSVPGLVVADGKRIYFVSKRKAMYYECIQNLNKCSHTPQYLTPDAASQLSDISVSSIDKTILITAETSGTINVFLLKGAYTKIREIKDSNKNISCTRMINNGQILLAGGYDMNLRVYKYTNDSSTIYSLADTKPLTGIIVDIAVNSVNRIKVFVFVAYGNSVAVYSCGYPGDSNLTFLYNLEWSYGEVTSVDSLAEASDISYSIVAVGGKDDTVCIYKYNPETNIHQIIDKITQVSSIFAVALSPNAKYLSIGKNDPQNIIYKQTIQNGNVKFLKLQTIKTGGGSNFARSIKFSLDGQALAQARDQSIIRTYVLGPCIQGYHLEDGFCEPNSYVFLYVIIGVTVLLIVILVILVWCKKKRIPGQVNKTTLLDDQADNMPEEKT